MPSRNVKYQPVEDPITEGQVTIQKERTNRNKNRWKITIDDRILCLTKTQAYDMADALDIALERQEKIEAQTRPYGTEHGYGDDDDHPE